MVGWDNLYADAAWRAWAQRPPLELTLRWIRGLRLSGATRVYDMGCGLGRHSVSMAEYGLSVVATDISPRAVAATRQALSAKGLRAAVACADMTSVPFPDEHFDGVLSIGVLEHGTRSAMEQAVAEVLRVLRPGGLVLASFTPRSRWIAETESPQDMLEDNTLRCYGPEKTIHHLVDQAEIRHLLRGFLIDWIDEQRETYGGCSSLELFASARRPER
ncbi:MAG: class I SAM-dependent methyltransferase [Armatimonadota bacterium]|nr:MAG: class I SAM-dependent methyltransferase [Armatimonadota bacterium]